jgi:hypothetical protein
MEKGSPQAGKGEYPKCQHSFADYGDAGESCVYCGIVREDTPPDGPPNPPMNPAMFKSQKPERRHSTPQPLEAPDIEIVPEETDRNYELEIIARMASRIAGGRVPYGQFNPTTDKRNLATELLEEIYDALFYAGGLALQLEEMMGDKNE